MYLDIDPEVCTGCRLCEAFCSYRREKAIWPSMSCISVLKYEEEAFYLPFTCQQCEKAVCAEVCPVQAIKRNHATGAWEIDSGRCMGCKMCVASCPFGGVAFDSLRGRAFKCDLCGGDPECVKVCPPSAIKLVKGPEAVLAKRRRAVARLADSFKGLREVEQGV
ncbi:Anaerobic dimethyl sulfoxide reductase chain B [Neomoorella glycerini]|uniref:Anaerobic dimethyl sulfoxide reductase chain B n=2 Tax=Neomoorella glycerini TaxID=55779 RepID=A0A6I5ZV81_9FIRM|nr:Anaerobic dimethyl sulfoxide reductase chain B [Moorella glycerini]